MEMRCCLETSSTATHSTWSSAEGGCVFSVPLHVSSTVCQQPTFQLVFNNLHKSTEDYNEKKKKEKEKTLSRPFFWGEVCWTGNDDLDSCKCLARLYGHLGFSCWLGTSAKRACDWSSISTGMVWQFKQSTRDWLDSQARGASQSS